MRGSYVHSGWGVLGLRILWALSQLATGSKTLWESIVSVRPWDPTLFSGRSHDDGFKAATTIAGHRQNQRTWRKRRSQYVIQDACAHELHDHPDVHAHDYLTLHGNGHAHVGARADGYDSHPRVCAHDDAHACADETLS